MSEGEVLRTEVHVFVYGTLMARGSAAHLLEGCHRVGPASIRGTLYEVRDGFPALLLAGAGTVHGEVWRCPIERLAAIDAYEDVAAGLFRRVGVQAGAHGCWTYVAGPALAGRLEADRRLRGGRWTPGAAAELEV